VFFVASPNRGSRLADADHMLDMIDVFTNFITNFPDGPVSYSIEVLLGVLKALAHTAERNLPGVAAMSTTGYIAETLNVPGEKSPAAYACATADYTPDPARDNAFFAGPIGDRIMDAVFTDRGTREANDLIVPSDGVWAENRHPSFPIQMRHSFGKSDHVWHTGFFAKKETFGWIKRHFEIGAQAQVKAVRSPPQSAPVFRQPSAPIARAPVFRSALPEAAPASAPGNAAAVTLRRQPTMKFPGLVEAGSTSDLEVNLVEVAATSAATNVFSVLLEAGVDALTLDVLVDAPGFEMVGAASGQVTLRRVRDAQLEKVAFRLTALAAGNEPVTREIRVDFLLGNSIVGSVRQRATVIPAGYAGARDGAGGGSVVEISIAEQRRDDCDLVIFVDSDDEHAKPPFRIRLRCTIPGQAYGLKKAGSVDLDRDVGSFVETTLQSVFDSVPQPQAGEDAVAAWDAWKGVFNSTLDALGKSLWDLLPKAFRDEYFRLVDLGAAPKSILVHSDEMVLPWELVIPYDERHPDMEPLGRAHVIGRWRTDLQARPMQQRLRVNRFCVLNPTYAGANALPWSVAEAQKLQQRFSRATLIAPASLPGVQQSLLGQTDVQLVHFTGHAEFNPANAALSSLLLENAKLPALLLTGSALLQKAQPVIYLNGCNAGQTGFAAGRPGGFAAVLLQGGCSGLIAPHWPVEDQSATAFSLALYEKLGFGRAIGEALQELRREHADDPTFRAFTYFGDPWTRLNLMGVT
jgi:hypothetical protein